MARRTVRELLGAQRAQTPRRPPAPRESILTPFEAEIRACLASDRDLRAPALLDARPVAEVQMTGNRVFSQPRAHVTRCYFDETTSLTG